MLYSRTQSDDALRRQERSGLLTGPHRSAVVAIHRAIGFIRKDQGLLFLLLLILLVTTTGCQFTQSAFTRTAGNAGAALAAASTTLTYVHEGKIGEAYAASSFVNYTSELDGLDQTLPSQSGVPDAGTLQRLLKLYKPAIEVIHSPCLDASCDWRAQVATLNNASKAFLEAGNS